MVQFSHHSPLHWSNGPRGSPRGHHSPFQPDEHNSIACSLSDSQWACGARATLSMWPIMTDSTPHTCWYEAIEVWIDGERLAPERIRAEYELLLAGYAARMSTEELSSQTNRIQRDAIENAIERKLLLDEARRRLGTIPAAHVEAALTRWRRERPSDAPSLTPKEETDMRESICEQLLLERFLEQLCSDVPRPTTEELRAWYADHAETFERGEQVHVRLITLPAGSSSVGPRDRVAVLLNVRDRLAAGETLTGIAREMYGGLRSEDLGWCELSRLPSPLQSAAANVPAGGLSEVFATATGHHLVQVLDRRPPGRMPFSEVWRGIEEYLWGARKEDCIGREADRLRAAATIEVRGLPSAEGN